MSKKRKTPRQQPPEQSQTQRPSPKLLKAKTKKARKGYISLSPLEVEIFLEMKQENQRLQIQEAQTRAQGQVLLERHNKIVVALGKTHRLDFRFKVAVNEKGNGLNYEEVVDDSAEGDTAGASPKA